jgi:RNA polymerase sigma-70 factor (ECF subfamily)
VANRTDGLAGTRTLLQLAKEGDSGALDELFVRYLPRLQRWARGRLPVWARDIADTQDLVQETLLQTFKNLEGFEYRGEGALQAYLRQALMNRVREQIRRRARRPEFSGLEQEHVDPGATPLQHTISRRAVADYERALGRLAEADREMLVGRLELGLSYEELARLQGRPSPDAARKATERALVRLISEMTGER